MKKRLYFLGALVFFILCQSIMDTYGLFETNSSGSSNFSIGKWVILLNENDISLSEELTLEDFVYTGNNHIEEGYFAPGGTAKLDLIIDATDTDVAFTYNIDFDMTALDNYPNILLSIKDKDTNQVITSGSYGGTMYLDDNRVISLELSLVWEDDEAYDESDTSLIDEPISLPVNIDVSQLIEE